MNGNWKFLFFCQKSSNHDQIRTWPPHSFDVSICQIWVECVLPLGRQWPETENFIKGHNSTKTSSDHDQIWSYLMIYTYVKFELNVCSRYQDNEGKLMMTEGRNNGGTEGRNGVTLYSPAILWRGIKHLNVEYFCTSKFKCDHVITS
jgi:hypothetical protein